MQLVHLLLSLHCQGSIRIRLAMSAETEIVLIQIDFLLFHVELRHGLYSCFPSIKYYLHDHGPKPQNDLNDHYTTRKKWAIILLEKKILELFSEYLWVFWGR